MHKLTNMEEKVQVDNKEYTVQQLVYAVRLYERDREKKRESIRKVRANKKKQKLQEK